jgi:hypothetical protein
MFCKTLAVWRTAPSPRPAPLFAGLPSGLRIRPVQPCQAALAQVERSPAADRQFDQDKRKAYGLYLQWNASAPGDKLDADRLVNRKRPRLGAPQERRQFSDYVQQRDIIAWPYVFGRESLG